MELPVLAGIALALFAIWFVCAPLIRSEEEIQPLYQSRPGVRSPDGLTGDDRSDVDYGPLPEDGQIRCPQCGTINDAMYDYCEECLGPLT